MRNWLKYLFLFWVLIFSTGIAMAQGPYEFTGFNTGPQTANSSGGGTIVYQTYLTVPLNQGNSLRHLDYDISWRSQGFSTAACSPYCPSQYGCAKINLYDNTGTFVQTLDTIYEYNVNDGGSYYNYTGSLDFNVPILSGYEILVELQAQWGWTSYVNAATITAVTGPLNEILIFEDDFQSSPINSEWSDPTGVLPALFTYNSTQVFGPFGSKTINLDLSALPTHTYIRVEFDLYIFDSWDGNNDNDEWKLKVDGVDRIHTDFDNHTWQLASQSRQSYPHNVAFSNPVLTGAIQTGMPSLNWSTGNSGAPGNCTSQYFINNITSHSSTSLAIKLQGLGLSNINDESWGIDNVKVYALGCQGILGCMDPSACNYNPLATCDDGSCDYSFGCTDASACNYDALATCDDGTCNFPNGCTDPTACNYDALATCDDNSCVFDVSIVTTTNACPGISDGVISVSVNPIDPSVLYTYTINAGVSTSYIDTIFSLSATDYDYEFFIDGIPCGVETITISEYAIMDLQTTVVDSTCDSSYAYVSVGSGASTPPGTVSTLSYCPSSPNTEPFLNASTSGAIIENITLIGDNNNIDNNTAGVGDFYEDYTASMYADITEGQPYTVDVTLNGITSPVNSASNYSGAKVYIDYNIDGVFDTITELVAIIPYRTSLTQGLPESINFTVPSTGFYGPTAMRVVSQNLSSGDVNDIGPCCEPTGLDEPWFGATEDYSIVLNAPSGAALPFTYLWSSGETDSITNSLVAATYTVNVTDANGCVATETVNVGELATISVIADSNQTICYGGEPDGLLATVQGYISGTTYSWSNPSDFNNATISNPVFINSLNLTATTNYIVTVTNDSNCTATDSITITVNPKPERPNITASPDPACEGDSITLTSTILLDEYKFQYRSPTITGSWTNVTVPGWDSNNPVIHGPVSNDIDFRVKIREGSGCIAGPWGGPTNQGITVPVNPLPSSGSIWHN